MAKHPADQLQPGINYLESKLSENPNDEVLKSMLTKIKRHQKNLREKWRPRYSNIDECTGSIL